MVAILTFTISVMMGARTLQPDGREGRHGRHGREAGGWSLKQR